MERFYSLDRAYTIYDITSRRWVSTATGIILFGGCGGVHDESGRGVQVSAIELAPKCIPYLKKLIGGDLDLALFSSEDYLLYTTNKGLLRLTSKSRPTTVTGTEHLVISDRCYWKFCKHLDDVVLSWGV